MRDTGIEPVTSSVSGKRSPAELIALVQKLHMQFDCEVETGIEPVCTALQAVASPLGHSTVALPPLVIHSEVIPDGVSSEKIRADDGTRTRDPHLGKVMRYQLRYIREAKH